MLWTWHWSRASVLTSHFTQMCRSSAWKPVTEPYTVNSAFACLKRHDLLIYRWLLLITWSNDVTSQRNNCVNHHVHIYDRIQTIRFLSFNFNFKTCAEFYCARFCFFFVYVFFSTLRNGEIFVERESWFQLISINAGVRNFLSDILYVWRFSFIQNCVEWLAETAD